MKSRKLKTAIAVLFIVLVTVEVSGQIKQIQHSQQVWSGYFNQTRFSEKWGAWADVHLRTKEDFFTQYSQALVHLGLTFYLNNDAKLTTGYAYVHHFPADNHKNIAQPEHIVPGSNYSGIHGHLNFG